MQQCYIRNDVGICQQRGEPFELRAYLLDFGLQWQRSSVGADDSAVILLLTVESAAPLPEIDGIRAVGHVVPGQCALIAGRQ